MILCDPFRVGKKYLLSPRVSPEACEVRSFQNLVIVNSPSRRNLPNSTSLLAIPCWIQAISFSRQLPTCCLNGASIILYAQSKNYYLFNSTSLLVTRADRSRSIGYWSQAKFSSWQNILHSSFFNPHSLFLIPLLFSSPRPNLIVVYFLCKIQSHETSGWYPPK